jgi:hypothetical protein
MIWMITGIAIGIAIGMGIDVARYLGETRGEKDLELTRLYQKQLQISNDEIEKLSRMLDTSDHRRQKVENQLLTMRTHSPEASEALDKAFKQAMAEAVTEAISEDVLNDPLTTVFDPSVNPFHPRPWEPIPRTNPEQTKDITEPTKWDEVP